MWEIFRKYHYLNTELNVAAHTYVALLNGVPVAHAGFLYQPLHKNLWRVHRLVVLPDYQGVGIGVKFISECARIMTEETGGHVQLMTTTPALVNALRRSEHWWLKDYGRRAPHVSSKKLNKDMYNLLKNSSSVNRITYSFYYKR